MGTPLRTFFSSSTRPKRLDTIRTREKGRDLTQILNQHHHHLRVGHVSLRNRVEIDRISRLRPLLREIMLFLWLAWILTGCWVDRERKWKEKVSEWACAEIPHPHQSLVGLVGLILLPTVSHCSHLFSTFSSTTTTSYLSLLSWGSCSWN